MKVQEIINRLKDTRGYINESLENYDEAEIESLDYMLEGIESAIQFFEEWLATNDDFDD